MSKIENLNRYNTRMANGMEDKLFFTKEISNLDLLFDFGCANGELIKCAKNFYPSCIFVGYDSNPDMITEARKNLYGVGNVFFFSNLEAAISFAESVPAKETACLFSSVLHEMFTYENNKVAEQLDKICYTGFTYIIARDMEYYPISFKNLDMTKLRERLAKKTDKEIFESFEKVWGTIDNPKTLLHFLLKYPYTDNWDRELHENYLPYNLTDIKTYIYDYTPVFERHYTLEYIKNRVKKDYGIALTLPTHYQFIGRR